MLRAQPILPGLLIENLELLKLGIKLLK